MSVQWRIAALVYVLLRDEMPARDVERLIGLASVVQMEPALGAIAYRYAGGLLGVDEDPVEEPGGEAAGQVERVQRAADENHVRLWGANPEGELSEAMLEWLDRFDERVLRHAFFVDAVNEAAEERLELTDETAQLVYARAQEMQLAHDAAKERTGDG